MLKKVLPFAALAVICVSSVAAQESRYARDFCIKVKPGKGAEYAQRLRDVSAKLARVRVDEGRVRFWEAQRAVIPMGAEARCDYRILYGYTGFPPEPLSPEQVSADLKKAGIGMSYAEMVAQRDELATLVNLDIWLVEAGVGAGSLGSYVVENLYRTKAGQASEWIRLEKEGWMPLAKAYVEQGPGRGWIAATRVMPSGGDLDYNALTEDIYPDWAGVGAGIGIEELWPKIHQGTTIADFLKLHDNVRTVHMRQVFQVVELVVPGE